MQEVLDTIGSDSVVVWIRAALILLIGLPLVRLLSGALYRMVRAAIE